MAEVYLLRHGEAAHNLVAAERIGGRSSNAPLTERGRGQTYRAGQYLANIPFSTFAASTAVRAGQSMQQVLAGMNVAQQGFASYKDLEEMTQGPADGKLRRTIYTPEVAMQADIQGLDFAIPGGETIREIGKQGLRRIVTLVEEDPEGTILVVGHGLKFRALLGEALGWNRKQILTTSIPNACLSHLTIHADKAVDLHYVGKDIAGTLSPASKL